MQNQDDLLLTNGFDNGKATETYGVQRELKRFALKSHLGTETRPLPEPEQEDILEDDLMQTNPANIGVGISQTETALERSRYIKEVRVSYNVDSRNRLRYKEQLVPRDPRTKQYTRECIDPKTGRVCIKCFTADDLNLEFQTDDAEPSVIADPFLERGGDIFYRQPFNPEPNCYQILFSEVLNNVKTARLVSSEIPNPFTTVNIWNNLILIDIQDNCLKVTREERCIGFTNSIPLKAKGCHNLPFIIVQLPFGNYGFCELLAIMERTINEEVRLRTFEGFCDIFRVIGDDRTGRIEIVLCSPKDRDLSFHLRFWNAPGLPQERLLYWMLGFIRPFERNCDGTNSYVKCFTNLYHFGVKSCEMRNVVVNKKAQAPELSTSLVHYGFHQIRPYRPINLQPDTYIFLLIKDMGTLTDPSLPSIEIFSKIQLPVPAGQVAYNTFVNTPKFFVEAPIRKLEGLDIKWIDKNGNLIDWHGLEHSFTIEFTQYLDRLSVNDTSATRGVSDPTSFTSKERIFAYNRG